MLAERTQNEGIVRVSVRRVRWEQQLFLEPQVLAPVAGPVREERVACLGAVGSLARRSLWATTGAW